MYRLPLHQHHYTTGSNQGNHCTLQRLICIIGSLSHQHQQQQQGPPLGRMPLGVTDLLLPLFDQCKVSIHTIKTALVLSDLLLSHDGMAKQPAQAADSTARTMRTRYSIRVAIPMLNLHTKHPEHPPPAFYQWWSIWFINSRTLFSTSFKSKLFVYFL